MPHTNRRRNKNPPHLAPRKLTYHTDSSGWTHVLTRKLLVRSPPSELAPHGTDAFVPAPVPPGLTLARALAATEAAAEIWRASKMAKEMRETMTVCLGELAKRGTKVSRVVVLALGSVTGDGRRRSSTQMAAAEGMRGYISSSLGTKTLDTEMGGTLEEKEVAVEMVAQDPVFNALDKEVLRMRGLRVVE